MKAYYPHAKTVYQGEKWMTIQFMLWWFSLFKENDHVPEELALVALRHDAEP